MAPKRGFSPSESDDPEWAGADDDAGADEESGGDTSSESEARATLTSSTKVCVAGCTPRRAQNLAKGCGHETGYTSENSLESWLPAGGGAEEEGKECEGDQRFVQLLSSLLVACVSTGDGAKDDVSNALAGHGGCLRSPSCASTSLMVWMCPL